MPFVNNKLAAAYERLFPEEPFEAHNALADAQALHQILWKKQCSTKGRRIEISTDLKDNSVPSQDCLEFARFRTTKLWQSLTKTGEVVLLNSLVTMNDQELAKVRFKNQ